MTIELFENPEGYSSYSKVGLYNKKYPIFIGFMPRKDDVAITTDDNKGILFNRDAFIALKKSDKSEIFLEDICNKLITGSTEQTELQKDIIAYLAQN